MLACWEVICAVNAKQMQYTNIPAPFLQYLVRTNNILQPGEKRVKTDQCPCKRLQGLTTHITMKRMPYSKYCWAWISTKQQKNRANTMGISCVLRHIQDPGDRVVQWHSSLCCCLTAPTGSLVQSWAQITVCIEFCMFPVCPPRVPPTSQIHAGKWINYSKLSLCLSVCALCDE